MISNNAFLAVSGTSLRRQGGPDFYLRRLGFVIKTENVHLTIDKHKWRHYNESAQSIVI